MTGKKIQLVDKQTGKPMAPKEMSMYSSAEGVKRTNSASIRQPNQTNAMGDDKDCFTDSGLAMSKEAFDEVSKVIKMYLSNKRA